MATLDDTSTDDEVRAALDANASYEEDRSVAKCRAYITAIRIRINRIPRASHDGKTDRSVEFDLKTLREEQKDARRWLAANRGLAGGSRRNRYASYKEFRQ